MFAMQPDENDKIPIAAFKPRMQLANPALQAKEFVTVRVVERTDELLR